MKWHLSDLLSLFYHVTLNMFIGRSAVYVLQMFSFILLCFDIWLRNVMKAAEGKWSWEMFVKEQRSARKLNSVFKMVFICSVRNTSISSPDWLLRGSVLEGRICVNAVVCVCVHMCVLEQVLKSAQ